MMFNRYIRSNVWKEEIGIKKIIHEAETKGTFRLSFSSRAILDSSPIIFEDVNHEVIPELNNLHWTASSNYSSGWTTIETVIKLF